MQIESQLQQRIEGILAKTLPPNSYLGTVKVEMENKEVPTTRRTTTAKRGGDNALFGQNKYVLPGVPQKKEFATQAEANSETSVNAFSAETLVKHITITILVAPDISAEQIRGIREVISGSVPFNPLRGDEMDIQNSDLLKPTTGAGTGGSNGRNGSQTGSFWGSFSDRTNAPMLMFFRRRHYGVSPFYRFLVWSCPGLLKIDSVAVLPRIGEQAAYTVSNAPAKAAAGANGEGGVFGHTGNGNGVHDEEEEGVRPFRFIREDQLNKLPILFQEMTPVNCALVLALPSRRMGEQSFRGA